jgi:nucleoside-diphosphate-sugar epimerase
MNTQGMILITGGAGFIGSHLTDKLLEEGYRVIVADNLLTGSVDNIATARKNSNFQFLEYDVTHPLPHTIIPDYIFHLASPASVIDYQNYPEETALVNSVGTRELLRLAKIHHARFLFASTSEIYGNPLEHPQKETYWGNVNPNGVRSCYDESKRFGEMITKLYQRRDNVNARIVRIFNTYGPRMRPTDGRVISTFINQAITNKELTVYGTGNQTRSFCYVSDLVSGIMQSMFKGISGEVYNLGNPDEYSMNDLAEKIVNTTESSSTISYHPLPEDDPEKRKPDITKAQKDLQWTPQVSLQEGLGKTIEYYQSL